MDRNILFLLFLFFIQGSLIFGSGTSCKTTYQNFVLNVEGGVTEDWAVCQPGSFWLNNGTEDANFSGNIDTASNVTISFLNHTNKLHQVNFTNGYSLFFEEQVMRLRFDEGNGALNSWAYDESVYNNSCILEGGPPQYTTDTPSGAGYSLLFNGSSGNYLTSNSYTDETVLRGNATFGAWVNFTSWSTDPIAILLKGERYSAGYFVFIDDNDNKAYCGIAGDEVASTSPITEKTWHHIFCNYNTTHLSIYVDGVFNNSIISTANIGTSESYFLFIGFDANTLSLQPFNGEIDEPTIYNRSLSASEILTIYNSTLFEVNYTFGPFNNSNEGDELIYFENGAKQSNVQIGTDNLITISETYNSTNNYSIRADYDNPSVLNSALSNTNLIVGQTQVVTSTIDDGISGIATVIVDDSLEGNKTPTVSGTSYQAAYTVKKPGTHTITIWATDNVGNINHTFNTTYTVNASDSGPGAISSGGGGGGGITLPDIKWCASLGQYVPRDEWGAYCDVVSGEIRVVEARIIYFEGTTPKSYCLLIFGSSAGCRATSVITNQSLEIVGGIWDRYGTVSPNAYAWVVEGPHGQTTLPFTTAAFKTSFVTPGNYTLLMSVWGSQGDTYATNHSFQVITPMELEILEALSPSPTVYETVMGVWKDYRLEKPDKKIIDVVKDSIKRGANVIYGHRGSVSVTAGIVGILYVGWLMSSPRRG